MKKILMIPGWGMHGDVWGGFSAALSSGYELVFAGWENLAADEYDAYLEDTAVAHDIDYVIAWSLGSLAAIKLLASEKSARVKGALLFGATARFVRTMPEYRYGWPEAAVQKMIEKISVSRESLLSDFSKSVLGAEAADADLLAPVVAAMQSVGVGALESGLRYLINADHRSLVESIVSPVLLVSGALDMVTPPAAAEFIQQKNARCTSVLLDGVAHAPFLSQTEKVLGLADDFFRGAGND